MKHFNHQHDRDGNLRDGGGGDGGPGHDEGSGSGKDATGDVRGRLGVILLLSLTFMGIEAAGGIISGSLALLADAGHMLSDATAILFSLIAVQIGRREATGRHTYGFRRAEFLAAFVNALGLVALAVWIVFEAVSRFGDPRPILGGVMFWVALAGLVVNLAALRLLHGHASGNLNLRSAVWHIMGDLLGSIGAVAAALVIRFTGWTTIDPLLSIGIATLIGVAGTRILYDSANLLMDRVPAEIDSETVRGFLSQWPGVMQVCDLHIWGVSSQETMLTAHLVVAPDADRNTLLRRLLSELKNRFKLAHMTLQLESEPHDTCSSDW